MVQKGLIHIYTGSGKGKTTTALGLCFRAAGWGIRSAFIQFMKGQETGELFSAEKLKDIMIFEQYGSCSFIKDKNSSAFREHLVTAEKGFARAGELLKEKRFSIVVLDEILTLPQFGLLPENKIIELIEMKPEEVELILTGRGATPELIRHADLVTEMKEIKHYYSSGVIARKGIEY
ncbi:MAG TPA: cob(I)yrinic acid a,c-diamide adenosyltransferase [Spirochaetota bacterium]|nr:cob(I)yrinic acid a,c-diamide adenosyltransferase [Spirochaetota bacterium]HPS86658.1 cob(I)yrinic acid a,c-diamide adenosyltransferase [Spirochaetota bacterium]